LVPAIRCDGRPIRLQDQNGGTFPLQSERLFAALKGLGAISKLVILPLETHGYRARESIMHTLYEQDEWLKLHVESDPPPSPDPYSNAAATPWLWLGAFGWAVAAFAIGKADSKL